MENNNNYKIKINLRKKELTMLIKKIFNKLIHQINANQAQQKLTWLKDNLRAFNSQILLLLMKKISNNKNNLINLHKNKFNNKIKMFKINLNKK